MTTTPMCKWHGEMFLGTAKATAKVSRLYTDGGGNVVDRTDFFLCDSCIQYAHALATRNGFQIEVVRFNRRTTDKLK